MFKRTLISTFFGLISAVLVSQAVAQTAVMKQFSPFSGGAQGCIGFRAVDRSHTPLFW